MCVVGGGGTVFSIRFSRACATAALVTLAAGPSCALAQGAGQAADSKGVELGAFRLIPVLPLSTTYNDNVTLRRQGSSDIVFSASPQLKAESLWSNNSLILQASSHHRRYAKRSEQNNDEYTGSATGRLDVTSTLPINASVTYADKVEERGTPGDDAQTDRYVHYKLFTTTASVSKQLNRFRLDVHGRRSTYRYDELNIQNDGSEVTQSFRDRDVKGAGARLDYQYSAVTSIFVKGDYSEASYIHPSVFFADRGSKGLQLLGGLQFEITRLLHGEASLGFIQQKFDDPQYTNFSGFNYDVGLTYQPTVLTTVTFGASRSVTDSALVGVPGVLLSTFDLGVNHELLRTVTVTGSAQLERRVYRGIDRQEDVWSFGLAMTKTVNRFLALGLSYSRQQRTSSGVGQGLGYTSNRFSATVTASK